MKNIEEREVTLVNVVGIHLANYAGVGPFLSGKVEISVEGRDGSVQGPTLSVQIGIEAPEHAALAEMPNILIEQAMRLVRRIANEPNDQLSAKAALSHEAKWRLSDTTDN